MWNSRRFPDSQTHCLECCKEDRSSPVSLLHHEPEQQCHGPSTLSSSRWQQSLTLQTAKSMTCETRNHEQSVRPTCCQPALIASEDAALGMDDTPSRAPLPANPAPDELLMRTHAHFCSPLHITLLSAAHSQISLTSTQLDSAC